MRQCFRRIALLGLLIYVLLFLAVVLGQRSMTFQPHDGSTDPQTAGLPGFTAKHFAASDGLQIPYWWHAGTDKSAPILIYLHGNGGGLHAFTGPLARLAQRPVSIAAMEYRGYPGAPGSPSEPALVADAITLVETLHAQYPKRPLILWGYSLGSGVATQAVHQLQGRIPITRLVLEAPFTSIANLGQELMPFFPIRHLLRDPFDSIGVIATIGTPVTILHGTADPIVPHAHAERLFAAAAEPKTFLTFEGGTHFNLLDRIDPAAFTALLARP
jgi:fermentation-respiration switch protein FrsA (DUF1100 family)